MLLITIKHHNNVFMKFEDVQQRRRAVQPHGRPPTNSNTAQSRPFDKSALLFHPSFFIQI
jgi:hypothetical protein